MIRILVAEDDLTSQLFMKKMLSKFGQCDFALNGLEAIDKVMNAIECNNHYDLICLDIMMPKVDGIRTLKVIRELESKMSSTIEPAKIVMTTALNDKRTIEESYEGKCDAFIWKPIDMNSLKELLYKLKLDID